MPPTLLADLASMLAASPEDVATKALELILARSTPARNALDRLLAEFRGGRAVPVARWASQVVAIDRSRTDLEGYDATEVTVAIFENKFWAGLTANQPATYLGRIPAGYGVLLFVVPRTRVAQLMNELTIRLPEGFGAFSDLSGDQTRMVSRIADGRTLGITSWDVVLSSIRDALEAAEDFDTLADLRQLFALIAKMDAEGFRPLSATDLTGDAPRLVLSLCDLVDGVVQEILAWPFANRRRLRATAGKGWYGHYFRMHGYCFQLIVSAPRWRTPGISPVWLRVSNADWDVPVAVRAQIASAVMNASWIDEVRLRDWEGYWLPITVLEGREREPVISNMVEQIRRIADVLESYALADQDDTLEPRLSVELAPVS
jgi:hypothetical protein